MRTPLRPLLAPLFAVVPLAGPVVVPTGPLQEQAGSGERGGRTELGRADRFFSICDYDADGWISFSEAEESLGIDRAGFRAYDADRDGRILPREFRRRYEEITASGGAFLPPRPKPVSKEPLPRTASELLDAYDRDGNRTLDLAEIEVLLAKAGNEKLEPTAVLEQLDRDLTQELEMQEIEDLLSLIQPTSETPRELKPRSIDELFGKLQPRAIQEGSTTQPVRITAPVRSFRRLDIDRDGGISLEDLAELQRPLVLPVRAPAVLAALDVDRDGAISEEEFLESMRSGR